MAQSYNPWTVVLLSNGVSRPMYRPTITVMTLVLILVCSTLMAAANSIAAAESDPPRTVSSGPFLLAPPGEAGPVVVRASFYLYDVNEINDEMETFEFTGVLTFKWNDPRQAFDPTVAGVDEKVFQSD